MAAGSAAQAAHGHPLLPPPPPRPLTCHQDAQVAAHGGCSRVSRGFLVAQVGPHLLQHLLWPVLREVEYLGGGGGSGKAVAVGFGGVAARRAAAAAARGETRPRQARTPRPPHTPPGSRSSRLQLCVACRVWSAVWSGQQPHLRSSERPAELGCQAGPHAPAAARIDEHDQRRLQLVICGFRFRARQKLMVDPAGGGCWGVGLGGLRRARGWRGPPHHAQGAVWA